ncbi:MAG: hypothetical protein COZ86_04850 [Candidatus Moranbacteria bacterium CG_4_8_14_3_um_filter_41_13]|nr:MAG: hypothetical protein COZ86_04850 [Candidatus Moranbacteria bacterium CG_4_8_14_3_um_filter_41_13]
MKKIVLSIAAVMAATAFAPEASAVPVFARQTGMACSACHFQSFPALTGFGKSFKTSGYTMMGAQEKIEGEHGLSIPATLNMGVYMQARYQKTNGPRVGTVTDPVTGITTSTFNNNDGRIDLPDEFSLFFGGRASENIGALTEMAVGGPAAGVVGAKFPIMFDVGSVKLGVVPFTVDSLGPQYGFDLFATGATANGRVVENGVGYSANMYLGGNTAASGASIVVANETFHVSLTPWAQGHLVTNAGLAATKLSGTYVRAAYTPTVADWDLGVGIQNYSGDSLAGVDTIVSANKDEMTVIDFQGQGEVAAMPVGIYGSYGWADAPALGQTNSYNTGTNRRSHFGLLGDLGVIPNTLNVQFGFARAKTGAVLGNESDNSYTLGLRYKLAQNVKAGLAYTKFSGAASNVGGSRNAAGKGDSLLNLIFSVGY